MAFSQAAAVELLDLAVQIGAPSAPIPVTFLHKCWRAVFAIVKY
jgi:hypothetical protein